MHILICIHTHLISMFAIQLQQVGDIEVGSTRSSYKDSKPMVYLNFHSLFHRGSQTCTTPCIYLCNYFLHKTKIFSNKIFVNYYPGLPVNVTIVVINSNIADKWSNCFTATIRATNGSPNVIPIIDYWGEYMNCGMSVGSCDCHMITIIIDTCRWWVGEGRRDTCWSEGQQEFLWNQRLPRRSRCP